MQNWGILVALVVCLTVASVVADDGDGQVVDGCYFFQGQQIGCLKVNLFDCDGLWDFQLTRTVGDAQLIVDSGINRFGEESKYSCFRDLGCTECILFDNIHIDNNVMTTEVTYSKQCGGDIVHVSFGTFLTKGVSCGSPGYFYLPCTRRGRGDDAEDAVNARDAALVGDVAVQEAPPVASVLSLDDDQVVMDAVVASAHARDANDFWFLGTDNCVYMVVPSGYSNAGDFVLLTCPVAVMDTCSFDTDLVASAGVLYHFPIFEGEDTSQCVGIAADIDACLYVTNANYDDNSVFVTLHMGLNAYGGEVTRLAMGVFLWEFPHCGDTLHDCAVIPTFSESNFLDSLLLPDSTIMLSYQQSLSYFFPHSSPEWSSHDHHHHHSPNSPHSPRNSPHSDTASGVDETNVWIGVMVGSIVLFLVVALVAAIIAGLAVIKKREERGEDLYNLFVGGSDATDASTSVVGEAADADAVELLTR